MSKTEKRPEVLDVEHAEARRAALRFWWGVLLVMLAVSSAGNAAHTYTGAPSGLETVAAVVGASMPVALWAILTGVERGWAARVHRGLQAPALVVAVVLAGIVFWFSYTGLVWVTDWLRLTADPHLGYAVAAVPDLLMGVATWFVMVLRNPAHRVTEAPADKPASPWRRLRAAIAEDAVSAVETRAARSAARRDAAVQHDVQQSVQHDAAEVQYPSAAAPQQPVQQPVRQPDVLVQHSGAAPAEGAVHQPPPAVMYGGASPAGRPDAAVEPSGEGRVQQPGTSAAQHSDVLAQPPGAAAVQHRDVPGDAADAAHRIVAEGAVRLTADQVESVLVALDGGASQRAAAAESGVNARTVSKIAAAREALERSDRRVLMPVG